MMTRARPVFWRHSEESQEIYRDLASLVAQRLKPLPAMWETWVQSLGQEDPLQEEMATHFSVLAWRIPSGPPSIGSKELDSTEHTYKNTG